MANITTAPGATRGSAKHARTGKPPRPAADDTFLPPAEPMPEYVRALWPPTATDEGYSIAARIIADAYRPSRR
jgi:hypothetical protein